MCNFDTWRIYNRNKKKEVQENAPKQGKLRKYKDGLQIYDD